MPKGNMWSSVPLPYCLFKIIINCCRLFYVSRAAAPKGAMSVLFSFCLTRGTEALAIIIRDLTVAIKAFLESLEVCPEALEACLDSPEACLKDLEA